MIFNIFLACVLTAAGGYLLGSILFGVLIPRSCTTMMCAIMAAATPA